MAVEVLLLELGAAVVAVVEVVDVLVKTVVVLVVTANKNHKYIKNIN